jgi:dipeptidyl aminopeptidase/acylaminoacyl peptidase
MRIALAVLALSFAVAAPADAQSPGVNGNLVFERAGGLWAVGTEALVNVAQPTRLVAAGRDPAWSARASGLAYSSGQGSSRDIWSIGVPVSGKPRRLTREPGADSSPTWSPGGGWIAFTSRRYGSSDVWVMHADGTVPRVTAGEPDVVERQPAWSPDGDWIAFASNREGSFAIWIMRPNGTDARQLAAVGGYAADPTWSPDSQRIAFAAGNARSTHIVSVDVATGTDVQTITPPGSGDRSPAWSPDGLQILFTHRNQGLWVAGATGAGGARAALTAEAGTPTRVQAGRNADWGLLPRPSTPRPGDSVTVAPTDDIMVKVPGSEELVPLDRKAQLPVDTRIETGDAAVDVVAAAPTGPNTSARLKGRFTYTQDPVDLTNELKLSAGGCATDGRAAASKAIYDNGYVSTKAKGPWKQSGPHSNGTSRRTAWYMKVTCDKEITVVVEGDVDVRDDDFAFPILVSAGQCYVHPSPDGRPLAGTCGANLEAVTPPPAP